MPKKIIIAIDGFASCGKSTLAKALAKKFRYTYIDSGAMYRAVLLYFLDNGLDIKNKAALKSGLKKAKLQFKINPETGFNEILLNGKNVEHEIREMRVSHQVSELSKIKEVRAEMVKMQKAMGKGKGIVMDGRDIGTVVYPKAELKLFMTADFDERVRRRYKELSNKKIKITKAEVAKNLKNRDHIDTHREVSPLMKAKDAVEINNTNLNAEEQLKMAFEWAMERIKK